MNHPVEPLARWAWVLSAYFDMEGDRQTGMGGARPTPFSVYDRFADREGMTESEYRWFKSLVRELDSEYMAFQRDRSERERSKMKHKGK